MLFSHPFAKFSRLEFLRGNIQKKKKSANISFPAFCQKVLLLTHTNSIGKRCCWAQSDLLSHPLTWHKIQSSSKGGNLLLSFSRDNSSNGKGHLNTGCCAMFLCQRYIRRFGDAGENKVAFLVGHRVSIPVLLQLTLE